MKSLVNNIHNTSIRNVLLELLVAPFDNLDENEYLVCYKMIFIK